MRVRFGAGRRVAVVDVPGSNPTVGASVDAAREELTRQGYEVAADFELSLDGRNTLAREDTLGDVGIVAGDLVRIVTRVPFKVFV